MQAAALLIRGVNSAQIIYPEDQTRMHSIGIIPSIQPTHATSDSKQLPDKVLTLFKTRVSQLWPGAQRPHQASGFETGYGHIVAYYPPCLSRTTALVL